MTECVYLMKNAFGLYKIGVSNDPEYRRRSIECNSGVPTELVKFWSVDNRKEAFALETYLHKQYKDCRTHGEWFNLETDDAPDRVNTEIDFYFSDARLREKYPIRFTDITDHWKPDTVPVCTHVHTERFLDRIQHEGYKPGDVCPSLTFVDKEICRASGSRYNPEPRNNLLPMLEKISELAGNTHMNGYFDYYGHIADYKAIESVYTYPSHAAQQNKRSALFQTLLDVGVCVGGKP